MSRVYKDDGSGEWIVAEKFTPPADIWIRENYPENGIFRVYWKDVVDFRSGGATLDSDEGEGLRWEWFYKDGQKDGVSRGWYPDGKIKDRRTWKNGLENGLKSVWHNNGQKQYEGVIKNGDSIGVWKFWDSDGKKIKEWIYKDNGEYDEVL